MAEAMRILFVTSECTPWSKTGGLADVSAALPAALRGLGSDVRVLMPAYSSVPLDGARSVTVINASPHLPAARLLQAVLPNGVPAFLVDCPALYKRGGGPYQNEQGADFPDNAQRFAQLCRVAVHMASDDESAWRPQVVHCNDWQSGLVPAYFHFAPRSATPTVLTIHNLAFQGMFPASTLDLVDLPRESFSINGAEFYGQLSFLKAGLAYADAITTVSPTYAIEIQRPESGMGLHGLLAYRRSVLSGILNGIDTDTWNPAHDPHIAVPYQADTLDNKGANKRALEAHVGLPPSHKPLLAMVGRLTAQKGIDLVIDVATAIERIGGQLVVLGRGDTTLEESLTALAAAHPHAIKAIIDFSEPLAHLIEAGADMFLMPSRFEPCGMNQMYSQRYGTVPVVHATGGLVDTVTEFALDTQAGTGFLFHAPDPAQFLSAIQRAIAVYENKPAWRQLQINGMRRDFSWGAGARCYIDIYQRLLSGAIPQPSIRARSDG